MYRKTIKVKTLVKDIPESIELDISQYPPKKVIHISDITLKDGLVLGENASLPVLTIIVPKVAKSEVKAEAKAPVKAEVKPSVKKEV